MKTKNKHLLLFVVEQGLAKSRSRREKRDRGGRYAALERLKKVKETGEKHKYDVSDRNMLRRYCIIRTYLLIFQETIKFNTFRNEI